MSNRIKKPNPQGSSSLRSRLAQIEQALGQGDIVGAAALAEKALAAGLSNPMILNLAAWSREETGDYRGAHRLLKKALELAPGDVAVMGAIGAVLRKEGRLDQALAVLDRVIAIEPRHSAAWLERGYTLDALRSEQAASESYSRAIAIDPDMAPALAKLADGAAKRGEKEAGRAFAARALAINPLEPAAVFALATMEIEEGEGAKAAERLHALLNSNLKDDDRTRSMTLLGDALDRNGRPSEAFEAYRQAQLNFRAAYSALLAPGPDRPSHRAFIETIAAHVERSPKMSARALSSPVAGAAATHVFLLGYPRSGTTLVENILASAPDVVALEERDTLLDADLALVPNDGVMPDLDSLDPTLVDELRAKYWERVRYLGAEAEGRTFVDMNPFNGIKLPVIARLFPDARILIMRRDPRDVVLSCFRVNFTPSPAAYAFSDLEETARHYDALMRLIELCRERLPLAFHEIRYDRLVADFETTVRAFADFIGIRWTDDFHAFDKTAQKRGVRTASATQVRRGLYDGGGRWRRYEDQLAPILPVLEPWVKRFGFKP
jgi:tetratricopeptide (TPR) repeat protein